MERLENEAETAVREKLEGRARRLYRSGESLRAVAKQIGWSYTRTRHVIDRSGLMRRRGR